MTNTTRYYQIFCFLFMFLTAAILLSFAVLRFKKLTPPIIILWLMRIIAFAANILLLIRVKNPENKIFRKFDFEEAWDIVILSYFFTIFEICIIGLLVVKGYRKHFFGLIPFCLLIIFEFVCDLVAASKFCRNYTSGGNDENC